MILPSGYYVQDAWELQKVVAVKLTNNTLAFYAKPLVAGNLQSALTFDQSKGAVQANFTTMDFQAIDANNFEMFGTSSGLLHHYVFTFD